MLLCTELHGSLNGTSPLSADGPPATAQVGAHVYFPWEGSIWLPQSSWFKGPCLSKSGCMFVRGFCVHLGVNMCRMSTNETEFEIVVGVCI